MSTEPNTPTPPAIEPLPPPPAAQPAPQVPPPTFPQRKSPGLAVVLSFFTGLGHLYLGLYQRGVAFFLAFAAAIILSDKADAGILVPFVWFFGLIDAYRQAQFMNLGYTPEPVARPLVKPKTGRGSLTFGIFLFAIGLLLLYNQFYPVDLSFLYDWWPAILVLAGAYLIVRHFLDQTRAKRAEIESQERL